MHMCNLQIYCKHRHECKHEAQLKVLDMILGFFYYLILILIFHVKQLAFNPKSPTDVL